MAAAEQQSQDWVIRIVYDGSGGAGKTTNIAMLSQRHGRAFSSPETTGSRTLYFDWMQYEGGSFEGKAIRCELLSVPGQSEYRRRRAVILSTADAVVYVVDASTTTIDVIARNLIRLRESSASNTTPGIVVQLNKSDLDPKVTRKEVQSLCEQLQMNITCITATACQGEGIQETFVMAVRAALQRLEKLEDRQARNEASDPEQFLAWIKACDQSDTGPSTMWVPEATTGKTMVSGSFVASGPKSLIQAKTGTPYKVSEGSSDKANKAARGEAEQALPSQASQASKPRAKNAQPAATAIRSAATSSPRSADLDLPNSPPRFVPFREEPCNPLQYADSEVMTWPSKLGRETLQKLKDASPELKRIAPDTWTANVQGKWRLYSGAYYHFADQEAGRRALLRWSRAVESSNASRLFSQPRIWLLAPAYASGLHAEVESPWRLWQILRIHASLRQQLNHVVKNYPPHDVARTLVEAAAQIFEVQEQRDRHRSIPAPTIHNIGSRNEGPQIIDVMPRPWNRGPKVQELSDIEVLKRSSLLSWRNSMWPHEASLTQCILAVSSEFGELWHRRAIEALLTHESQRDSKVNAEAYGASEEEEADAKPSRPLVDFGPLAIANFQRLVPEA